MPRRNASNRTTKSSNVQNINSGSDQYRLRGRVVAAVTIVSGTYSVDFPLSSFIATRVSQVASGYSNFKYRAISVKIFPQANLGSTVKAVGVSYVPDYKSTSDFNLATLSESSVFGCITPSQTNPITVSVPSATLSRSSLNWYDCENGSNDPESGIQGCLVFSRDVNPAGDTSFIIQLSYIIDFAGAKPPVTL